MMKLLGVVVVCGAAALAGCSTLSCGDPHAYLNSGSRPPLKAPAGMSVPPPDPAYEIAGVAASTGKRTDLNAAGACLINPPQVVPAGSASKRAAATPAAPAAATSVHKAQTPAVPAPKESTSIPAAGTSIPANRAVVSV